MKKIFSILAIAITLLYGCGNVQVNDSHIKLYYINNSETDLVKVDAHNYPKATYDLDMAIKAIREKPSSDSYKSMLLGDVKLLSAKNNNGIVDVNLSREYNALSTDKKLLVKAAIVQAITIVKDVDGVKIYIDGKDENDRKYYIYTSSSFLIASDNEKHERQRAEVIFYFLDLSKNKLIRNVSAVVYSDEESLEYNAIKSLIQGPASNSSSVVSALPEDTIIYDAKTVEGVCHVKLNNALSKIENDTELRLAVYSIVNTLSSIPGIKSVQIYSDNEAGISRKGNLTFNKPIIKDESEDLVILPTTDGQKTSSNSYYSYSYKHINS